MANVIGRRIAGNLVYVDQAAHLKRLIDAIGPDVIKYFNDFVRGPGIDAAFDNDWTVTRVEAGAGESTATLGDVAGGALLLTTDAAENDGLNLQALGECFHLAGTGIIALYFGARFKVSDATQSDFFIGLCDTDTDILGGADDSIGFRKADGSTAVSFVTEKGTTETTLAALTCDTEFHIVEFYYDAIAGTLEVFVDGVSLGNVATTNLPDEEQRVSVHFLTGEAVAKTMTIDWIKVIQIGGRA
jgi:hypothetical protein